MRWKILICFLLFGCSDIKPDSEELYNAFQKAIRGTNDDDGEKQESTSPAQLKRYGIECGTVRYEISGLQQGIQLLFFDNYGLKEAKYTWAETLMPRQELRVNKLEIIKDGYYYIIDYDKKSGMRMRLILDSTITEPQATVYLAQNGSEFLGTEKFMQRDCEVWETRDMANTSWLWCGIILKSLTEMQGLKIEFLASEMEWGIGIPGDKFFIPPGIEILDGDSILQSAPEYPDDTFDLMPEGFI